MKLIDEVRLMQYKDKTYPSPEAMLEAALMERKAKAFDWLAEEGAEVDRSTALEAVEQAMNEKLGKQL